MTVVRRLDPKDRKDMILEAALKLAAKPGAYSRLTRASVAAAVPCAEGLVSRYFGTMTAFRRSIMRAAIQQTNLPIIAQGLACGDTTALKVSPKLKEQALSSLSR